MAHAKKDIERAGKVVSKASPDDKTYALVCFHNLYIIFNYTT